MPAILTGITPTLLWLDDFGAGSSTLWMLSSGIFEYVETDKNFFWKYGEGRAFDALLNHINDLCRGAIVQDVDTHQHLNWMANKSVVGFYRVPSGKCAILMNLQVKMRRQC